MAMFLEMMKLIKSNGWALSVMGAFAEFERALLLPNSVVSIKVGNAPCPMLKPECMWLRVKRKPRLFVISASAEKPCTNTFE